MEKKRENIIIKEKYETKSWSDFLKHTCRNQLRGKWITDGKYSTLLCNLTTTFLKLSKNKNSFI